MEEGTMIHDIYGNSLGDALISALIIWWAFYQIDILGLKTGRRRR